MSETRQARLSVSSSGANLGPQNRWQNGKQKPHIDDHRAAGPAWSSHYPSPSFDSKGGQPSQTSPSLIDRLGPKVASTPQPRSLLERMTLENNEATDSDNTSVVHSYESSSKLGDAVLYPKVRREEDGETNTVDGPFGVYHNPSEDGVLRAESRPRSSRFSWNRPPTPAAQSQRARASSRPTDPSAPPRSANTERECVGGTGTSEPPGVDKPFDSASNPYRVPPEPPGKNHDAPDIRFSPAALVPAKDASHSEIRAPLPLQARIGRALRLAVFQNAKLREKAGTMSSEKVQSKIAELVTDVKVASFEVQMRKVKQELDASRAGRKPEEVMARAKGKLLNGFENRSGTGGNTDNTWLTRRDSHSLIPSFASTSILPTPPPSESLPGETMNKAPPKAPRAMLNAYTPQLPPRSVSLKGKEKAIEPLEDTSRRRRYSHSSLRSEPTQNGPPNGAPRSTTSRRERSPYRRASASPPQSPLTPHKQSFRDELPTYRSPPSRRGPPRSRSRSRGSIRSSTSRVPLRSPSRSSARRSRSRPRRPLSPTLPSYRDASRSRSRTPPPSTRSNGVPHGRTFSGAHRPPSRSRSPRSPILNSRYVSGREKRPFIRSPSPYGPLRSPPSQRRKLAHRSRSPSGGPYDRRHTYNDAPNGLQSPFKAQYPAPARVFDSSPALPPPPPATNPCNTVPNLWFVKVGADAPRIVEGAFIIEPEFATVWGVGDRLPARKQPASPKLRVTLLCLPTAAVIALSDSLRQTMPTPASMTAAFSGLATEWPRDGTLILDMNRDGADGKSGRTWLPQDIDPTVPLDVTDQLRPGRNVIRFIQLAGMLQYTFILCASHRNPLDPDESREMSADLSLDFDDPPQPSDSLFSFSATVTVSQFL